MDTLELGPSRAKTIYLYALVVLFVLGGLLLISGGGFGALVGLICIVFFGGGGWLAFRNGLGTEPVMTLTRQGIHPISGGVIPWNDISHVEAGRMHGTKCVGVVLNDYTAYLESLPESAHVAAKRTSWFALGAGAALIPANFNTQAITEAVVARDLKRLVNWDLLTVPKQDLAKMLVWSRRTSGYDVAWGALAFGGNPKQTVATIYDFWRRAAAGV